jgi:hypothetical protein
MTGHTHRLQPSTQATQGGPRRRLTHHRLASRFLLRRHHRACGRKRVQSEKVRRWRRPRTPRISRTQHQRTDRGERVSVDSADRSPARASWVEDVQPGCSGDQRGVGPRRSSKTADIDKKRLVMIILVGAGSGAVQSLSNAELIKLLQFHDDDEFAEMIEAELARRKMERGNQ